MAESKDLDNNVVMLMIIFFMLVDTSHVLVVSILYYIYDLIIVVCLSIVALSTAYRHCRSALSMSMVGNE